MSTDLRTYLDRRERLIKDIRYFLDEKGFHEVIPTVLNSSLPLEPTLYSYETTNHLYLPTSPESYLKKYIALTGEKCYCIAPSFRNLEVVGPLHKPEFLMLEIYEPGNNYENMMNLTNELISDSSDAGDWNGQWPRLSLVDAFQIYAKLDLPKLIKDQTMEKVAKKLGYETKNATWEQLYNQIFLNLIEPSLPKEPFFLVDYPSRISPLARPKKDNSDFAERFELYINGIEIGNGNTENSDIKKVRKSMQDEQKYREQNNLPTHPIDQEFLQSLAKLPYPTAGIGIGIDRLTMLLNNEASLPPLLF